MCASKAVLKKKLIAGQPLRGSIVYGVELRVEVVRAVDVAEVAHVLVVLGRAGEAEGVVAADGVAHDLDERLEIVVEELGVESGRGVGVPHQRARRRRVEAALLALPGASAR